MILGEELKSREWVSNSFGDEYVADMHQGIFDKSSSESVFDKYYWNYLHKIKSGCVIFYGSDSGLLYKYIVNRFSKSEVKFIIFDLDCIVDNIKKNKYADNVSLLSFKNVKKLVVEQTLNQYIFMEELYYLTSLSVLEDCLGLYKDIVRSTEGFLQDYQFSMTAIIGYKSFHVSNLLNIPFLKTPLISLKERYLDKQAMIIAGGPSLDHVIKDIKRVQDSVYIFAVARVVSILAKEGIVPDYVVSVDPFECSYFNSVAALDVSDKSRLICSNHAHPKLVGQWLGEVYYVGDLFPWEVDFSKPNASGAGPTVTNTAIKSALIMGFKKILLAGVDLCHNSQGFTHAKGSTEADVGPYTKTNTIIVKNYDDEEVETTVDFYSALNALKLQAFNALDEGAEIINLSSKAAVVENIKYQDLAQVLIFKSDKENITLNYSQDMEYTRLDLYLDEVLEKKQIITRILKLISESGVIELDIIENQSVNSALYDSMVSVENELNAIPESFHKFIKLFGLKVFYKTSTVVDLSSLDINELVEYNKNFFNAYKVVFHELLELFDKVLKRIKGALIESSNPKDWSLLEDFWKTSELPLRAKKIITNNDVGGSVFVDQLYSKMINIYMMDKEKAEKNDIIRFENIELDVELILKAYNYFIKKSISSLYNLWVYSENRNVNKNILTYMCALLKELEGEEEVALGLYQSIVESSYDHDLIIKYTLERVFSIASKIDEKMALSAIECLSLISPYYLKHFAEAKLATGDFLGAIDKFADYHEYFPKDISNLIRLAEVYNIIGHKDRAIDLLDVVLNENPDRLDVKAALRLTQYS